MTAVDDYKLFINILARDGITGDVLGKWAKAKVLYDQVSAIKEKAMATAPPIPPINPQPEQPLPMEGEVPEMGMGSPQESQIPIG